jgi:hypothetical protein
MRGVRIPTRRDQKLSVRWHTEKDQDYSATRWFRSRRRIDELDGDLATPDSRQVVRAGFPSSLSAQADGGGTVGLTPVGPSGAAAPNNPEAQKVIDHIFSRRR